MSGIDEAGAVLSAARAALERDATGSLPLFERAARLASRGGQCALEAEAELGWGEALYAIDGREPESLVHLHRAALFGAGSVTEARAWLTIADVFRFSQDADHALAAFDKSATLFDHLDDARGECLARHCLAKVLQGLKHDEEALPQFVRAGQLALSEDDLSNAAEIFLGYGELLLRLRREKEAAPVFAATAEMFQQLGEGRLEARARMHLIALSALSGDAVDYPDLIRLTELSAERAAQEGDAETEGIAQLTIARLLAEQGRSGGRS